MTNTRRNATLRASTVSAAGQMVEQTYEQKVLQEMMHNQFDYVHANGWLGNDTAIYVDGWRHDNQLASRAPLGVPRSWEPNHGVHPLNLRYQTMQPGDFIQRELRRRNSRLRRIRDQAGKRIVRKTALPLGDINENKPSTNLPFRKPSVMRYSIDTSFTPREFQEPAGYERGPVMKSIYSTWNLPYQSDTARKKKGTKHRYPLQEQINSFLSHVNHIQY